MCFIAYFLGFWQLNLSKKWFLGEKSHPFCAFRVFVVILWRQKTAFLQSTLYTSFFPALKVAIWYRLCTRESGIG